MIEFSAPAEDAPRLRALGAKPCAGGKWKVARYADYPKFAEWIKGRIFSSEAYIAEVGEKCPYCGADVRLVAVALGRYREDLLPAVYGKGEISLLFGLDGLPEDVARTLREEFGIKKRYFAPYGYSLPANGCHACGRIFNDEYLFGGEEAPFGLYSAAERLRLYSLPRGRDRAFGGRVCLSFKRKRLPAPRKLKNREKARLSRKR